MDTLGAERRRRFLVFFETRFKGDRAALMAATGLTKGRVSQLFDPEQPFGEKAAASLASRLRERPDLFERDPPQMGVAQDLILDEITVPSTRTIDELRSMSSIPASFKLHAPDDALSPKVPRGMPLIMSATNTASPNQVILVRDRTGDLHLRRYGQAVGGWRAIATNDAYLTLESERDGLELVAALRWVDGTAF